MACKGNACPLLRNTLSEAEAHLRMLFILTPPSVVDTLCIDSHLFPQYQRKLSPLSPPSSVWYLTSSLMRLCKERGKKWLPSVIVFILVKGPLRRPVRNYLDQVRDVGERPILTVDRTVPRERILECI